MTAASPQMAHRIRLAQQQLARAQARPQGNYDHHPTQWGVVEGIDFGPPLLVSVYPDGAQNTGNPAYLMGKNDPTTQQIVPGIPCMPGYVPTKGDVVVMLRGMGRSSSDRLVLGKLNGAPSPYPLPLGGINAAGQWVQGPGALWGGSGAPTIPIATSSQPGASDGDWYLQIDAPAVWQVQAGAWAQVLGQGPGAGMFTGVGSPASTLGAVGSWYFQEDSPHIFQKQTGGWAQIV